jgi:hypothetical protein
MSAAPMGRAGRNATEGWGANSVETIRRQALPRTVMWPVCDQTVTVSSAASAALWTPSSLMWISCASRDVSVALVNVEEDVTHEVEGSCRVLPCSGAFRARPRSTGPVGFQNVAMVPDQRLQAAASYSLRSPPRIGRRRIGPWTGSGIGDVGRGGRSPSARCGRAVL